MGTCTSKVMSFVEDNLPSSAKKKRGNRKGLSDYAGEDGDDSHSYGGGLLANDENAGGRGSFDYGNLMDDIKDDKKD